MPHKWGAVPRWVRVCVVSLCRAGTAWIAWSPAEKHPYAVRPATAHRPPPPAAALELWWLGAIRHQVHDMSAPCGGVERGVQRVQRAEQAHNSTNQHRAVSDCTLHPVLFGSSRLARRRTAAHPIAACINGKYR